MNEVKSRTEKHLMIRINCKSTFEKIHSYMVAILCSGGFISVILNAIGLLEDGILPIISLTALFISVGSCFVLMAFSNTKVNFKRFLLIIFIFIMFGFSYLRLDYTDYLEGYLIEFLFYGGVAFIMVSFPMNFRLVIESTSLISLIFLINPIGVLTNLIFSIDGYSSLSMGASYSVLPCVTSSIIHYVYYRSSNFFVRISYIVNLFLLGLLVFQGSRGTLVSLIILIYIIFYSGNSRKGRTCLRAIISWGLLIILLLIVINIEPIISGLQSELVALGVNITALDKSVIKMSRSGLLNGRDVVYKGAIDLIIKNPLFGSGISAFANETNGGYPHNIFLQLFSELGIFFSIPFLFYIGKSFYIAFSKFTTENSYNNFKIFIIFCFTSSIPRLMFSSYLWQDQIFWFLLFSISGIKLYKHKF